MVYVTGDTHGNFQRFEIKHFPEQIEMTKEDYVIVCGDFGGLWDGSAKEAYWLDWLDEKPFTTLFVDGNHENFTLLNRFPEVEWHGGKVHQIRPSVFHLMRGQLYEIAGYRFFTMGGAASHDIRDGILDPKQPDFEAIYWRMRRHRKLFRIKGVSWWPEELPTEREYVTALDSLEHANWNVDYVISHCAPTGIQQLIHSGYQKDTLTDFLDMVSKRLEFNYWLFGHYHDNRNIGQNYVLLWEQIVRVI